MKRIVTLFLVLALALPAAACASDPEVSEYYGYGHIEIAKDGSPYISIIYFAPDQTCYYTTQLFRHDEPGLGRSYVGTWGYTADGHVFAKTGENTTRTFTITSAGGIVDKDTMEVFIMFDALMK